MTATTTRETEVKGILDAVDHALRAEHVPDAQRQRIMNRVRYGHPDGSQARRYMPPLRALASIEDLTEPTMGTWAAAFMETRGLRPDGTIPGHVEPADVTWADVTDPEHPRFGSDRAIEIRWATP
jgi:hypothetical protein